MNSHEKDLSLQIANGLTVEDAKTLVTMIDEGREGVLLDALCVRVIKEDPQFFAADMHLRQEQQRDRLLEQFSRSKR